MINLKVNRQLQITFLIFCFTFALALFMALKDQSPAAGQVYGQTTATATTPTATQTTAGVQTTTGSPTTPGDQAKPDSLSPAVDISTPAVNNPESIIQLLKDSNEAVKTYGQNNMGAGFHEDVSMSVEGKMTYLTADGHIIAPDRISMNAVVHVPGGVVTMNGRTHEYGPERHSFEARLTSGGNIFLRSGFSEIWHSTTVADLSDFNEEWDNIDFTQFIINPEYMGQETTKEGYPVHHVRVGINAAKVTEKAEENVKPEICDKTKEEIGKLSSSTITYDIWIGVNDKLVYQSSEKFLNTDLMVTYDDMIEFYKWGEKVDIVPPPADKVEPINPSNSNDKESCPA